MKKLNPYQREVLYKRLAEEVCEVHKKPGNALYYQECVREQYKRSKKHVEAEDTTL